LTAFFRHHGVWAPGVKLLRRLQFGAKAFIIALVFCIPAVVLSWSYFGDKSGAIALAATQRDGVAYLREVLPLAQLARQHRAATLQAAFTGKDRTGRSPGGSSRPDRETRRRRPAAGCPP
jgi:hypothetical protein